MKHDKKLKWLVTVFKVRKWSFFESFRSLTQSKRVCMNVEQWNFSK